MRATLPSAWQVAENSITLAIGRYDETSRCRLAGFASHRTAAMSIDARFSSR
jgi:hypothetical protein